MGGTSTASQSPAGAGAPQLAGIAFVAIPIALLLHPRGLPTQGLRVGIVATGAADYVTKPFDFEELLARMHRALRIKRTLDRLNQDKRAAEKLSLTGGWTRKAVTFCGAGHGDGASRSPRVRSRGRSRE